MITEDEAKAVIHNAIKNRSPKDVRTYVAGFVTGYCNGAGYKPDWVDTLCEIGGFGLSAHAVRNHDNPIPSIVTDEDYQHAQAVLKAINEAEDNLTKRMAVEELNTLIAEYESKQAKHS